MLDNNRMSQNFGRVLISSVWKQQDNLEKNILKLRVPVKTEEEYMKAHKKYNKSEGGLAEIVGLEEYQVKPYFDLDPKGEFDYSIVDDFIKDLKKICDVDDYIGGREAREDKGIIKHSRRIYLKARITYSNIPIIFKDLFDKYHGIIDTGVYTPSRCLYTPLSDRKKNQVVPELKVLKGSIFDCCATYILEDYEDLDLRISTKKSDVDKLIERYSYLLNPNETPKEEEEKSQTFNNDLNFTEIITKLKPERAVKFEDWKNFGMVFINLYHREIISKGQAYDLFHLFSSKAENEYDKKGVDKFIDINISRLNGKGYGIKYLLECLKIDNPEYYKSITTKDLMIESANDDIGASEIIVNVYKDIFIICNGVLNVKHNDIWVSKHKEVDNILIDLIGKIDIKFYGADGKRKYSYNKSIKHIKDCITCIRAKQSIINNKFYEDMIKNNKYYLPFSDGIYSFKEKKLYSYKELPHINFSYKIDRNFPKFNKDDYDDLMNKVIIPIYPNEDERNYNAHIKARALAGCYEDKKWYGYSGSRNSGKGTETGIFRSAFGNFVLEFNAKCLILNKFINPDVAKALSWVVDKKDARIIISNEIDGDENTVLNGAFIKTLASGGDAVEGRKNYQDEISFIPQFTMFLCYNRFYKVEPQDATENLEQFEYKSKFVGEDELIEGVPFLKLKDDNIKEFVKQDRLIDAYTLYMLSAFTDPRMNTPENIKNSTEINNGEKEISVETFILNNFINSNNSKDRLHTESITNILNDNGYIINKIEVGKLMNRVSIGKYNKNCSVENIRKTGYDCIKYLGKGKDEV